MPDTPIPATTPSVASTQTRKPKASENDQNAPATPERPVVHYTLQSKGGVGKTFVASHIAQYLLEHRRPVICFDADPNNHSLARIAALKANQINLFDPETGEVSVKEIDRLLHAAATEPGNVVIDGGASTFQPLADYLIRINAPGILAECGRDMLVHTVIVGGSNTEDTMQGAKVLLEQMPEPARFVIWLNDYFGPASKGGLIFEETALFAENRNRIAGIIRLKQLGRFFVNDIIAMLDARQTYAEAIKGNFLIQAQRLIQVRRSVWDQLVHVI